MKMTTAVRHLGIQQRIMLYVVVGLAIMFGAFAFVGFRATERATQLVFQERLNIASTMGGILERDFLHVERDVQEAAPAFLSSDRANLEPASQALLGHLSRTDPFPFFQVTGIAVISADGRLLAESGAPLLRSEGDAQVIASAATE